MNIIEAIVVIGYFGYNMWQMKKGMDDFDGALALCVKFFFAAPMNFFCWLKDKTGA